MNTAAELSSIDDEDDDDIVMPMSVNSPERAHPPLSPATPAESFFLSPELKSSNVSAFALAAEIRRNKSARSIASMGTDEFATAASFGSQGDSPSRSVGAAANTFGFPFSLSNSSSRENLFGKDVLVHSRDTPSHILKRKLMLSSSWWSTTKTPDVLVHSRDTPSHILQDDNFTFEDSTAATEDTMMTSNKTEEEKSVDAATTVYESVKNVWTWGKGVPVIGFGEGVAEAVAGKVLGLAGTSIPELDTAIKPHVAGLDTDFLNPAINAVVGAIMGGVSKGDDMIRPVVMKVVPTILGPLGMVEDEKKKPVTNTAPELTTPAPAIK
eukprot:CAMPEP_0194065538 /NCGR_PEP_ID=MMETSP0009_2-20130614/85524_1 /TAXON_ID=210454 /ORGANISM="Grammatophora oceanica, Strain CCMP 410" /LENGTH=324 /DNA_ID=CAMNT_0038718395 /DNA_START=553 /DNA_END=1527 /DNA_ORIENTATION=-